MFRTRTSLVLAALTAAVSLVAPSVFADDPPDSHRPNDPMMQDRDPYDPLRDEGQRGNVPGTRPGAPSGEAPAPYQIERRRTGEAESLSQSLGGGSHYVDRFNWFMARTLPLSPLVYPIGNDVSVEEWVESCATSKDGWATTTCYGGGWGGEKEKRPAAVSVLTPDAT